MNFGLVGRTAVSALILSAPTWAIGQTYWIAAEAPFYVVQVYDIYTDTIGDALYVCGESSIDGDNNFNDQGISIYSDGQWDTLATFSGGPMSIIRWQDSLIVGGYFLRINGDSLPGCAAFANGVWSQYGSFPMYGGPMGFRIINGELYAIGAFSYVDSHLCKGLAKRVGNEWQPVGDMSDFTDASMIVGDVIEYQGNLVITGAGLNIAGSPGHGVAIFDGIQWEILGPGIEGTWGNGRCLAIYQNELYLGGGIHVAEGNVGEGLLKWTGSDFVPVGTGLQNANNQWALNVGASAFKVRNDLLYISGQFWHAGNVPAYGVATWDGTDFCGFGGMPAIPVDHFDFYRDTLYVSTFHTADGMPVNCVAKYVGTYPDTCSSFGTTVQEEWPPQPSTTLIRLNDNAITISGLDVGQHPLSIHDSSGRLVFVVTISTNEGCSSEIAIGQLGPGAYSVICADRLFRFMKY